MTIILGLDVSTCTGYAAWDSGCDPSSIEAGVIELPEAKSFWVFNRTTGKDERKQDYHWDDWRVAQVGPKIRDLLRRVRPDLVLVEERMRFSKSGDGGFAMTNAIHGAIYSHCCTMGFLFGTIYSQSWRRPIYGGVKRPLVPDLDRNRNQKVDPKTGKLLFKEKDWGDLAVEKCEGLGINLPAKKDISHNAAEAALIAMTWHHKELINIPETRAHDRYIALLQQRNERQVAA